MPTDRGGDTRRRSTNLRRLRAQARVNDSIGAGDEHDYYRFKVSASSKLTLSLNRHRINADLELLNRRGRNIATSTQRGRRPEAISQVLERGTYYVHVSGRSRKASRYRLVLKAEVPTQQYFEFIYRYGDGGDSYSGFAYAPAGTYRAGQTLVESRLNELGRSGSYQITAVSERPLSSASPAQTVFVRNYFDHETRRAFSLNRVLGSQGLGSESGYLVSGDRLSFFSSYREADLTPPPSITLTTPNGGDRLTSGISYDIRWSDTLAEPVRIDLYRNNAFYQTLTPSTASTGSYTWTVSNTLAEGTNYTLRLTSTTRPSIFDTSNAAFSIVKPLSITNPESIVVSPSGTREINALINRPPFNRKWDKESNRNVITYSFLRNQAAGAYSAAAGLPGEGFSELTSPIKTNIRSIFASFERFLDVDFVEVEGSAATVGVLNFMFSDLQYYAGGTAPGPSARGGDVRLSPNWETDAWNGFSQGPGNHGYETLIHEIGHALGLKHPGYYESGDQDPFLTGQEDNNTNTVMTYNNEGFAAITFMPYDIRALQYLYGEKSYQTGNTVYTFSRAYHYTVGNESFGSSSKPLKQALWDRGGTDTLDFSGLSPTATYRFDLREGGLITTQSAYNAETYVDEAGRGTFETSSYGTSLAFGTRIENLIASRSSEQIYANSAANVFSGYGPGLSTGTDTYYLTDDADVLDLSGFQLAALVPSIDGNHLRLELGNQSRIHIQDYFGSQGSMGIKVSTGLYRYRSDQQWVPA